MRKFARAWITPDVSHRLHAEFFQQRGELLEGPSGMTDGENSQLPVWGDIHRADYTYSEE
jgi:hypothetical protein